MNRKGPVNFAFRSLRWLFLILPLFGGSGTAWASKPDALEIGARVRISAHELDLRSSTGIVRSVGVDTLVLILDADSTRREVPFRSISRLELSRGTKGHLGAGVRLGLVLGGVAGLAIVAASSEFRRDYVYFVSAVGGAVGGMIVGGIVGAAVRSERWTIVRKIGDVRLGVGALENSIPIATVSVAL